MGTWVLFGHSCYPKQLLRIQVSYGYSLLGALGSSRSIEECHDGWGASSSSQPRVPMRNLYLERLFWTTGVPKKYPSTHPSSHPFWSVSYQLPSFRNWGNVGYALPNPWDQYPCNIDEIYTKINYEIIEGHTCSSSVYAHHYKCSRKGYYFSTMFLTTN